MKKFTKCPKCGSMTILEEDVSMLSGSGKFGGNVIFNTTYCHNCGYSEFYRK